MVAARLVRCGGRGRRDRARVARQLGSADERRLGRAGVRVPGAHARAGTRDARGAYPCVVLPPVVVRPTRRPVVLAVPTGLAVRDRGRARARRRTRGPGARGRRRRRGNLVPGRTVRARDRSVRGIAVADLADLRRARRPLSLLHVDRGAGDRRARLHRRGGATRPAAPVRCRRRALRRRRDDAPARRVHRRGACRDLRGRDAVEGQGRARSGRVVDGAGRLAVHGRRRGLQPRARPAACSRSRCRRPSRGTRSDSAYARWPRTRSRSTTPGTSRGTRS